MMPGMLTSSGDWSGCYLRKALRCSSGVPIHSDDHIRVFAKVKRGLGMEDISAFVDDLIEESIQKAPLLSPLGDLASAPGGSLCEEPVIDATFATDNAIPSEPLLISEKKKKRKRERKEPKESGPEKSVPEITFHEQQLSLPAEAIQRARTELMPFPELLDDISSDLMRSAMLLQAFKDYPGDVWPGLDSLRAQVSSLQLEKEELGNKCKSAQTELSQAREMVKSLESRMKKNAKDAKDAREAARKVEAELHAARDNAEKEKEQAVAEVEKKLSESFEEQLQLSKKRTVEEYKRSADFKSLMTKSLLSGKDMTVSILKHCFQGLETSFLDDFGSLVKGGAYKNLPVIEVPAYPVLDVKALLAAAEFAGKEAGSSKEISRKKAPEQSLRSKKSASSASTPSHCSGSAPKDGSTDA